MLRTLPLRNLAFAFVLFTSSVLLSGCGSSSGPAEFDASSVPPVSAADEQSAADYEAQMEKERIEQYGQ